MAFKVPTRITSLIGVFDHMFRGGKSKQAEVVISDHRPWPMGAEKVMVTWSKPVVLRNAETLEPVSVEAGGYVLNRNEATYGFEYKVRGVAEPVAVEANEAFWVNRVAYGFVTVVGS